jgi:hypothetical protein
MLLSVIVSVLALPIFTFPKGTVLELVLSCPLAPAGVVLEEATPAHPVTKNHESRAERKAKPHPRRRLFSQKLCSQMLSVAWHSVTLPPKKLI